MSTQSSTKPSKGGSVSHLVLNVRDIEASHHFYTELLGFDQCAELTHTMTMRFYRGDESHHHDFALVQVADPDSAAPPEQWTMEPRRVGVNHIAIGYPDRESWLNQLAHLRANGVEFIVRGNHGMPPHEIRPRYHEVLEYLALATTSKHVTFHGEHYDYEDIPSMPRPRHESRRRHWMTIYSSDSAANAARRDYKICTGYQPSAGAKVAFDAYRDACAESGRDCSPDDIGVRRQVLICESDAQADELHDLERGLLVTRAFGDFEPDARRIDALLALLSHLEEPDQGRVRTSQRRRVSQALEQRERGSHRRERGVGIRDPLENSSAATERHREARPIAGCPPGSDRVSACLERVSTSIHDQELRRVLVK